MILQRFESIIKTNLTYILIDFLNKIYNSTRQPYIESILIRQHHNEQYLMKQLCKYPCQSKH